MLVCKWLHLSLSFFGGRVVCGCHRSSSKYTAISNGNWFTPRDYYRCPAVSNNIQQAGQRLNGSNTAVKKCQTKRGCCGMCCVISWIWYTPYFVFDLHTYVYIHIIWYDIIRMIVNRLQHPIQSSVQTGNNYSQNAREESDRGRGGEGERGRKRPKQMQRCWYR